MSQPDDTIFDFFDEEPAQPPAGLRGRLPRRGGGRRTPPRSLTPLLRLTALVVFILFLLLVFALLISSCTGTSRHAAYAAYMGEVNSIAQQSSGDGGRAVTVLTMPGLTPTKMSQDLAAIAASEQKNLSAAQHLSPPGRLRTENADLIEALQLRVSGLSGLAAALSSATDVKATQRRAEERALSEQASQLLASDIVWEDLFVAPAVKQLRADGIGGVTVPSSHFIASTDVNLFVTPAEMAQVLKRLSAAGTSASGTCTGLHGTSLVSVEALPQGAGGTPETLTAGKLNDVTTSSTLEFQVTIEDSGDYQEVDIPVQLTIGQSASNGGPITRTATVQLIDPGQDASVLLDKNLDNLPFAQQTTLTVNVDRVCGETNTTDNSAQYNVIFTLPG